MNTRAKKLREEVLELPKSARAKLAHDLLLSLEDEPFDSPEDVDAAWTAEIDKRVKEVKEGRVKLVSATRAVSDVRTALKRVRVQRAAGLGEEFVSLFERRLDAAASHRSPGTRVPYVRSANVRWLLLTLRFPYGIVLLLEPRAVIAVAHLRRKPAYWNKRAVSEGPAPNRRPNRSSR